MDKPTVSYSDERLLGTPITLTNCDREPIHIPGAIQPYGCLLCLDEYTRRIVQASANTETYLGQSAESLIGADLSQALAPDQRAKVEALFDTLGAAPQLLGVRLDPVAGRPYFKIILHRYDGVLWLEFEPVDQPEASPPDLPFLNAAMGQMLAASTVLEFCQHTVDQVRAITGFDRVAIYRFAADESGEVIAEAKRDDLAPWLGIHYPASDIPQQARAMYLKNWLRFIPDAGYAPVPLVPVRNPVTGRPPDMTYAVLRSVSPIHLEYLRNMGSAATMTISLIQNGKLWGMVTCHHLSPRLISYELRDLCQFIGKTFSALLSSKEQLDDTEYQLRITERQSELFEHVTVSGQTRFVDGLCQHFPTLQDVFDCGGAAVCFNDEITTLGATPAPEQIRELLAWLQAHVAEDVFSTTSYAALNPAGLEIRSTASGIIAASLADAPGNYLLWFRPEQVRTVTWAGQNEKPQALADGQIFLSPRQSFEAWKQLVENTSAPWRPVELEAAKEIRLRISDIRLKVFNELQARARSLTRLNAELARSNDDLDSFAYVASHDLKEPLRGIHNYSLFLLEDYADQLDEEGVHRLRTLVRLSQRMESLIESLLQLSRVGRAELELESVDLNEVLDEVRDLLQLRFEETHTQLVVRDRLPTVLGDRIRLQEVISNLFSNAMKYNDLPEKVIRMGEAAVDTFPDINRGKFYVFYVQDNGIGIDPRHQTNIFKLFKRLHTPEKYGGGTGAGLAIAKKMVEKHGGALWVDSQPGQGATFYFTIPK
ncbi:GAF domain-containing protein [Hymenobacter sp. BT523]|uniref:ATP-binding protein n=1 Tax=Hymenobacter sp. BT523 TaxID=2795725 RepID=UPI0018EDEC3C|nr:ATP-binding protein [Hymenobacter sp. BT523]MBJ6109826.1 GAF domain-containing protein [Hymenobacter sp. BT523]